MAHHYNHTRMHDVYSSDDDDDEEYDIAASSYSRSSYAYSQPSSQSRTLAFAQHEHEPQQPQRASTASVPSYQPGQYLAPILTGETLQLPDPLNQHSDSRPQSWYTAVSSSTAHYSSHHDTEAYASSYAPRHSFPQPRSRSPTPAVDDEDYHIVGDDSIHYTGDDHSSNTHHDPEKAIGSHAYLYTSASAYNASSYSAQDSQDEKIPYDSLDTPLETRHFGPAPTGRIRRRHKTKKRVQLTNGNLVVDLPVPPKLVLPRRGDPEMLKTRYTAVTCDPDEFEQNGFFLRQNETGRRTELFIVVTMYNEDEILFCRTMYGIMLNIAHLGTRKNSQTWGKDAWKKVVVCIVSDGRKKIHPRVLDCLALLGVYQPGDHMKNMVNNKEVTAHLFEYTTSFALDPDLNFKYPDKGIVPTQILFCLKEKNQKKINSHRWFFNAFAPLLQPNVCVLLDVGTRPGKNSIYRLWKTFDLNSNVAGACGEISAYKGKNWSHLLNPLVAAQNFEYKVAGILDKTTESIFGYISVLPGAFSAYRYIALQNDRNGVGPLASYFKGEVLHGSDTDIFTSNMYLAEDRILCFELVAKAGNNWILKYVKGAIGETDVPDAFPEFIGQRRRWLNGSFFAATYAIAHVGQILRSGHSFGRKIVLLVETIYNVINLVFSWFSLGNFYLFFVVLTSSLEDPSFNLKGIAGWNPLIQYIMGSLIVACFLLSMGNKPATSKTKFMITSVLLALLMAYLLFASVMCALAAARQGGSANSIMLFSVVITFGLYAVSSLLAFDPWHMFTSFLPYLFLSPTYINILNVYAFCNLDDISWGTKQDNDISTDLGAVIQDKHHKVDVEMLAEPADVNDLYEEALRNLKGHKFANKAAKKAAGFTPMTNAEKEQRAKDYYANVRTNVLLLWVLSNGLLLVAILSGGHAGSTFSEGGSMNRTKGYLVFILAFTAITNMVRFLGSTLYLMAWMIVG